MTISDWMDKYYILNESGEVTTTDSLEEWGTFMEQSGSRMVRQTMIGEVMVSTVFLGLDHRFGGPAAGIPILWETLVFGGPHDGEMDRYTSVADAIRGHDEFINRLTERNEQND